MHAKLSPPGTEEKLMMNVDAREVELVFECVCEKEKSKKGEEEMRLLPRKE